MLKVFEATPDFVKLYGDDQGRSTILTRVYNNKDNTGGPFTSELNYINSKGVKVPNIKDHMDYLKIDVLGFYTLRRLQIDDT